MRRTPIDKLRLELGWTSLETRRKIHKLLLFHQIQTSNQQMPSYVQSILPETRISHTGRTLRNSNTLTQPNNRTTIFKSSFIPSTTKLWNSLPLCTRQLNYSSFKRSLYERFNPPHPPKFYTFGSKRGNSLHTKIRVGASQLNAHLFQYQLTDSPACDCGHPYENTEHFFLHCILYNYPRTTLFNDMSTILDIDFTLLPKPSQINILIHGYNLSGDSGRKAAFCIQKFILSTQRFR